MFDPNTLRTVEKSQTLLLNEQSRQLEQSGKKVYKFGFGQSPFLPPQPAIDVLKAQAARKEYSPVQGIADLRKAVAEFHNTVDGLSIKPENVLIAPGSKILIYAVMAAFKKADVLVPAPSWVSYVPQAHLCGHDAIRVITSYEGRWRVTPEALEKAVAQKKDAKTPSILILNYPGNPDGLSYSAAELEALAATMRKHNILVVSDEIYGLLNHTGEHVSLAKYYPEGTIITTGLSKWAGAGGWRMGVALMPDNLGGDFKDILLGIASETYSCAAIPVQLAACEAYKWNDGTKKYVETQRRILRALGNTCQQRLEKAGIRVVAPQGGFYLFLDFSELGFTFPTSNKLCEQLLAETNVALLPGTAFSMDASHLSARLAYVDFDGTAALEAASKSSGELDEAFLKSYTGHVLEGIDAICQWANAASGNARRSA